MTTEISVRPMKVSDLSDVHDIQCAGYAEIFHEPVSMFHEIVSIYDKLSYVAVKNLKIVGYLLSQPSDEYRDDFVDGIWSISGNEECVYLHDLCVYPDYHKHGIARLLFSQFCEQAKNEGFKRIIGVCVQGSAPFWQKRGFTIGDSYPYNGEVGHYMKREL